MSSFVKTCAVIAALGLLSQVATATEGADVSLEKEVAQYVQYATAAGEANPEAMNGTWSGGIRWTSGDKRHEVRLVGRLQWDSRWASSDDYSGDPITYDATYFRRVRLGVQGHVYTNVVFKLEVDFAKGSQVDLKDVYVGLRNLPESINATVLAGHFKEPFSLEQLTSSRFITMMERALPVSAFAPDRNAGVVYFIAPFEKRMTAGVSITRPTDDAGQLMSNKGYAFTGRVSGVAFENDDHLVHLGLAGSYRKTDGGPVQFMARPATGNGLSLWDTGPIAGVDAYFLLGAEIAYVWKGLHVEGEFITTTLDGGGDASFYGWYFKVGYFIFGEKRPYNKQRGVFDVLKPNQNLLEDGGWGAVEVAYRIDFLDLSDSGISGGEGYSHVVGVNWYWNPNTRMMINFVYVDITSGNADYGEGNLFVFEMRFQFWF